MASSSKRTLDKAPATKPKPKPKPKAKAKAKVQKEGGDSTGSGMGGVESKASAKAKEAVAGSGEDEEEEVEEVTVQATKKGTKGKERAKTKTKKSKEMVDSGSDASDEGEGGADEGQKEVEGEGGSAKAEPLDTLCNDAILGYCRINLFNPPAPIVFGQYNKRPLVEAKAQTFATNVGGTNVRPFARGNMLPLVISKDDVESECIQLKPNVEKAPFLKLKVNVAKSPGYGLKLAGGRHRYRAMQILKEKSQEMVKTLKDKMADVESGIKKLDEKGKRYAKAVERIEELKRSIKVEEEVEETLSVWGVILYDEEAMLANNAAGALHLSVNEAVLHYDEGPAERMERWLVQYNMKAKELTNKALVTWVGGISKQKNSKLGQVLNCMETRTYLNTLEEFSPHFMIDAFYGQKFCFEFMHNINGGFLGLTVKHCAAVLKALFTDANMPMATKAMMDEYLGQRTEGVDSAWTNRVIRTWNGIFEQGKVRQGGEATEMILNEMEALDLLFTTNFKEGKFFMTSAEGWTGMWAQYVKGLERYGTSVARRGNLSAAQAKVFEEVHSKIRFLLTETHEPTLMPPMPLMTRSVVPMMIKSIEEVAGSLKEIWSWFDWSAPYVVTRTVNTFAKDISAWTFRSIEANGNGTWDDADLALRIITSYLWRNVDALISMQTWLDGVDTDRPSYSDVVHQKVDDALKQCYQASPEVIANMKQSKKNGSEVVTTGLWPLDVVSKNDWRESSHAGKIYAEWVAMAKMEIKIIQDYRVTMLQECPAAVSIRLGLAEALGEACKVTAWEVLDEKTGKMKKQHIARFVYVDKIPANQTVLSEQSEIDVVKLKENRARVARSQALAKEGAALLKKVQQFKGSLAVPGSKKLDNDVAKAIKDMRLAMRENIARLSRMEEAMDEDPNADLNPWYGHFQPDKDEWPQIPLMRRSVWEKDYETEESGSESHHSSKKGEAEGKQSTAKADRQTATTAPVSTAEQTIPIAAEKANVSSQDQTLQIAPSVEPMDVDAAPTPSTPRPSIVTYSRRSSRLRELAPPPAVEESSGLESVQEEEDMADVDDDKTPRRSSVLDLRRSLAKDSSDEDRRSLSQHGEGPSNANAKRDRAATLGSPDAPVKKKMRRIKAKASSSFDDEDEDMEDGQLAIPPASSPSE